MDNIYRLIKLNQKVKNHRVKFGSVLLANVLNIRHLFLRFDPIVACNLSCTMCYFSDTEYRKKNKGIFNNAEIERLANLFFPKAVQLIIGCGTEPTLYKDFTSLVKTAKNYKIPYVGFTTNGQLLTEQHIKEFIANGLDELILSVHGVKKETYETFMVNATFDKFHSVLQTINSVKEEHASSIPHLRMNYTVNPDNLEELINFFDVYGKYNIKTLQIRPIMDLSSIGNSIYRNYDLDSYANRYKEIIEYLGKICKTKKITFLANLIDPVYKSTNYDAVILDAVVRYISPIRVWRNDFDWKNETYDEYCKRVSWKKHLAACMLTDMASLIRENTFNLSAKYEVNF